MGALPQVLDAPDDYKTLYDMYFKEVVCADHEESGGYVLNFSHVWGILCVFVAIALCGIILFAIDRGCRDTLCNRVIFGSEEEGERLTKLASVLKSGTPSSGSQHSRVSFRISFLVISSV